MIFCRFAKQKRPCFGRFSQWVSWPLSFSEKKRCASCQAVQDCLCAFHAIAGCFGDGPQNAPPKFHRFSGNLRRLGRGFQDGPLRAAAGVIFSVALFGFLLLGAYGCGGFGRDGCAALAQSELAAIFQTTARKGKCAGSYALGRGLAAQYAAALFEVAPQGGFLALAYGGTPGVRSHIGPLPDALAYDLFPLECLHLFCSEFYCAFYTAIGRTQGFWRSQHKARRIAHSLSLHSDAGVVFGTFTLGFLTCRFQAAAGRLEYVAPTDAHRLYAKAHRSACQFMALVPGSDLS